MQILKMLGGIVATLAVFAFVLTPVSASAAIDQTNDNTGNNSTNTNRARFVQKNKVKVTNKAKVKNNTTVVANTGGNEQNRNTTAGDQTSGNVDATITSTNTLNSNACGCPLEPRDPLDVEGTQSNSNTGNNSDNVNSLVVKDISKTTVKNTAKVTNNTTVVANTGDNEQNANTTGGSQTSGDVTVAVTSTNTLN